MTNKIGCRACNHDLFVLLGENHKQKFNITYLSQGRNVLDVKICAGRSLNGIV